MRQRIFLFCTGLLLAFSFRYALSTQVSRTTELTVFAAASLNEAFNAIAEEFERANPGVKIVFNFAGSQQLVRQIAQGAPADLLASANMKQMFEAVRTGRIDSSSMTVFARNRLVVVYPGKNSAGITALHDLGKTHLKIVLADKAVPAGQYALDFLDKCNRSPSFDTAFEQNVLRNVVSYEENVKAVVSKVVLGEADAGIVYASDISKKVSESTGIIEIPDSLNVVAEYPIAIVRDTPSRGEAEKFLKFVVSAEGVRILARFGFIPLK